MKLYIDDIREAPEGWTLVRTITEAIRFIAFYGDEITEFSLDHDISFDVRIEGTYRPFPSPDTFQPVAYFICEKYRELAHKPHITIHSANPVGAEAIESVLKQYAYFNYEIKPMSAAHRPK